MRSPRQRTILLILWSMVLVVGLLSALHLARAEHPMQDQAIHEKFYSTWQRPDDRQYSCCGEHDCYPVEAKLEGGTWFFKHRETGNWLPVPVEKIETERDNPDGRNHVCANSEGFVFCFIPGGGA